MGRYFPGLSGDEVPAPATFWCRTTLKLFEHVAEYEESSMFSMLCTQSSDCGPATYRAQGERRSMRLAPELVENSDWDNG